MSCFLLLHTFERIALFRRLTVVVGPCLACFSCLCHTRRPQSTIKVCAYFAVSPSPTGNYFYTYNDELSPLAVIVINHTNNINRIAEQSSRSSFTGKEVLALLNEEEEDGMIANFDVGKYLYDTDVHQH